MEISSLVSQFVSAGFYMGAFSGTALGVPAGSALGSAVAATAATALIPISLIYSAASSTPMDANSFLNLIASPYTYGQIGAEYGGIAGGLACAFIFGGAGAATGYAVGKVAEPLVRPFMHP